MAAVVAASASWLIWRDYERHRPLTAAEQWDAKLKATRKGIYDAECLELTRDWLNERITHDQHTQARADLNRRFPDQR